jgi:hypothetical protein
LAILIHFQREKNLENQCLDYFYAKMTVFCMLQYFCQVLGEDILNHNIDPWGHCYLCRYFTLAKLESSDTLSKKQKVRSATNSKKD